MVRAWREGRCNLLSIVVPEVFIADATLVSIGEREGGLACFFSDRAPPPDFGVDAGPLMAFLHASGRIALPLMQAAGSTPQPPPDDEQNTRKIVQLYLFPTCFS